MAGKRSAAEPEVAKAQERPAKAAAPTEEPTKCDFCGKALGVHWFSLADKAYCSPCFHAQFWTPSRRAPKKAR